MNSQKQNKNMGEISRVLMEKARKGLEFGKIAQPNPKDAVHVKQSQNNHTGIDRGRWGD